MIMSWIYVGAGGPGVLSTRWDTSAKVKAFSGPTIIKLDVSSSFDIVFCLHAVKRLYEQ